MPRIGRVVLPGYPHHIIQRGHNRQVVFAETRDFAHYLGTLAEFKAVYGVKVYAYCLMTNHVHLLVAPQALSGLAQLMKRLAGRQNAIPQLPRETHRHVVGESLQIKPGRHRCILTRVCTLSGYHMTRELNKSVPVFRNKSVPVFRSPAPPGFFAGGAIALPRSARCSS
jgi:putative transposase